jgi:hypothetical protein
VGLRIGLVAVKGRKFLTTLGLELRPLGCPARSQSLSRLLLLFVQNKYLLRKTETRVFLVTLPYGIHRCFLREIRHPNMRDEIQTIQF